MRRKLNGEQYAMDRPAQAFPQDGWRGDIDQTRAFYRRTVATALADMAYKQASYARHFNMLIMADAIQALEKLAQHLEVDP